MIVKFSLYSAILELDTEILLRERQKKRPLGLFFITNLDFYDSINPLNRAGLAVRVKVNDHCIELD